MGVALHDAKRRSVVDGPANTVSPLRAINVGTRPSCKDAALDAIDRLRDGTGVTTPATNGCGSAVDLHKQPASRGSPLRQSGRLHGAAHVMTTPTPGFS